AVSRRPRLCLGRRQDPPQLVLLGAMARQRGEGRLRALPAAVGGLAPRDHVDLAVGALGAPLELRPEERRAQCPVAGPGPAQRRGRREELERLERVHPLAVTPPRLFLVAGRVLAGRTLQVVQIALYRLSER